MNTEKIKELEAQIEKLEAQRQSTRDPIQRTLNADEIAKLNREIIALKETKSEIEVIRPKEGPFIADRDPKKAHKSIRGSITNNGDTFTSII